MVEEVRLISVDIAAVTGVASDDDGGLVIDDDMVVKAEVLPDMLGAGAALAFLGSVSFPVASSGAPVSLEGVEDLVEGARRGSEVHW